MKTFPGIRKPGNEHASLVAGLLDNPSDSGWEKAQQFLQCLERVRVSAGREKRERQAKVEVEI
jgi:hypothetical protein